MRRARAAVGLSIALACSCKSSADGDRGGSVPAPAGEAPSIAAPSEVGGPARPGVTGASLSHSIAALPEAPAVADAMRPQLGTSFYGIDLVGVSRDRRAIALHVEIEDVYRGQDGGGKSRFSLYLVVDTWTGQVVEAFQDRGKLGDVGAVPSAEDRQRFELYKQVWEAAHSRAEWGKWRREHHLVGVPAARQVEGGQFSLSTDAAATAAFGLGKLEVSERRDGFELRWTDFYEPVQQALAAFPNARFRLPDVELGYTPDGGSVDTQLVVSPQVSDYAKSADPGAHIEMIYRPHLDATAKRVIWTYEVRARGLSSDEHPPWGRYFVATLGPQVEVVDGGAGTDATRRVAALLEQGGVPVTRIDVADDRVPVSAIYYRGSSSTLASQVRDLLPGSLPTSQLSTAGWADIRLVLGADARIGP